MKNKKIKTTGNSVDKLEGIKPTSEIIYINNWEQLTKFFKREDNKNKWKICGLGWRGDKLSLCLDRKAIQEKDKEIKVLEVKRKYWEQKFKKLGEKFNKEKDEWVEERGRMANLLFKKGIKNW